LKNHCYIFIGPSGSGKTTLASHVFSENQKIISYTTRPIRKGEQNQKDYYFVSNEQFEQMIQADSFAEYDIYGDFYYGVTKETLEEKLATDNCYDVLTSTGFWTLYKKYGQQIVPIFLTISKKTMIERLHIRNEKKAELDKRIALFEEDLKNKKDLLTIPAAIFLDAEKPLNELKTTLLSTIDTQQKETRR
jgi:guanylate kinase